MHLLAQDKATVPFQATIFEMLSQVLGMRPLENTTAETLGSALQQPKAWERVQSILTRGGKERAESSSPEMSDLNDKAMGLYEKLAGHPVALGDVLVSNKGIETLKSIVQGKNGNLIPRGLEVLFLLVAGTGTAGRRKITEEMGQLLRETSSHEMLQSAIVSVLSEMAKNEESAQGLVDGQGQWPAFHV